MSDPHPNNRENKSTNIAGESSSPSWGGGGGSQKNQKNELKTEKQPLWKI